MISVYGGINLLSYGLVTTNLTNALCNLGKDVQLFAINPHNIECEPKYQENIKKSLERSKLFFGNCPVLKIWHQWEYSIFPQNNLRCGFPIFELDNLTIQERHNLNSLDLLFVCSEWARKVCKDNNIETPIRVVPLGIDPEVFYPSNKRIKNKTIYTVVGKWEYRKSHREIITAFNAAFSERDKVELWMMCDNIFLPPEQTKIWHDLCKNSKLSSKIKLLPRQPSQNDVKYILDSTHFLVCPSKAEGWNLPANEAMACGVIPIITNYGATQMFTNTDNSFLIEPTELERAEDDIWFKKDNVVNNGKWMRFGQPQMEQLIEHFRNSHRLNMEQSPKLIEMRNKCLETVQKFTWKNTATNIISQISTFA